MHALSMSLYGKPTHLVNFPINKQIKGIGMSDWEGYSAMLSEKFDYENTYYDVDPKLDLRDVYDCEKYSNCDFVICSEVMEHVVSPYETVLPNIRRILKHDGTLIFSTPYTNRRLTKERFPGIISYTSAKIDGNWIIVGKGSDGGYQVFDQNIHFHGGPGSVLELRVFSEIEVLNLLHDAGYSIKVYDKVCLAKL
jgi:SAM-dependent methyltransferase